MAATTTRLPSGRVAGLSAFGDPMADRLAIICHPSPGTADFDPDPTVTNRWGVHLMGLDRPGYGSTDPLPAGIPHSLWDRADDVADLVAADERNADRISNADLQHCGVIGWGAGAVVAAALAVRHPGLVDRLALVSPPAPAKAEKLARRVFAITDGRAALHIDDHDPAFGRHLGLDRRLDRMIDQAFTHGRAGADGDRALLANTAWVALLRDAAVDVLVLTGMDDPLIDDGDLRWWRRHLPAGARFEELPGSASLAIADGWERILAHIAPAHGHIREELRDHGRPIEPSLPDHP